MNKLKTKITKERCGFGGMYSCGGYFDRRHMLILYIVFATIYIYLPWNSKKTEDEIGCEPYMYGIQTFSTDNYTLLKIFNSIFIQYGNNCKILYMPWDYTFIYRAIQSREDEKWYTIDYKLDKFLWKYSNKNKYFDKTIDVVILDTYEYLEKHPDKFYRTYNYKFEKLNQESKCKYYVCEYCWRPKWLKWTDKFSLKRRTIEVEFENEMGPRVGSWKGGVLSCMFTMKENETPEECIKRMEKEYTF